jgi:hypothetical protein
VVNALRWCAHPGGANLLDTLPPEDVQPLPTTFERAAAAGIATSVVNYAQFAGSGLTRAVQRGGRYAGVHALGDLAAEALRALESSPSFCYAYHSELDLVGHVYGPDSAAWRMQLRRLRAGVRAFGGEARARHVYAHDGAAAYVLAAWREKLGDNAWVVTREEAVEAGWFGPTVSDRVRPRIGDIVAAARGGFAMTRREAEPIESSLIGHHGSLTSAEQLVPLVLAYG